MFPVPALLLQLSRCLTIEATEQPVDDNEDTTVECQFPGHAVQPSARLHQGRIQCAAAAHRSVRTLSLIDTRLCTPRSNDDDEKAAAGDK